MSSNLPNDDPIPLYWMDLGAHHHAANRLHVCQQSRHEKERIFACICDYRCRVSMHTEAYFEGLTSHYIYLYQPFWSIYKISENHYAWFCECLYLWKMELYNCWQKIYIRREF